MQLAHTSLVCENHFKPQDIIHPNPTEKFGKKLVPGAVPLRLKPYEGNFTRTFQIFSTVITILIFSINSEFDNQLS